MAAHVSVYRICKCCVYRIASLLCQPACALYPVCNNFLTHVSWGMAYSHHCATRAQLAGEECVWGPAYSYHCATRARLAGEECICCYALLTAVLSPMGLRPPVECVLILH
jgi:hypothetical protein